MDKEKMISFTKKPTKHGKRQTIITIPAAFIKHGLIDPDKEYKIYMEEVKDE